MKAMRARIYLLRHDVNRALREATSRPLAIPELDMFMTEPTSGLDWPWLAPQVAALANAKLGRAEEGAHWLSGIPAGTLPELRAEVAGHSKAAEQLMDAMTRKVDNAREEGVVRDAMAVSLARLRVIAGQQDLAIALVNANAKRLEAFCVGLSELLWTAGLDQSKDAVVDRLRATCTPKTPNARPVTEPVECGGGL